MSKDKTPPTEMWKDKLPAPSHPQHLCDRCNRELAYSNEVMSQRMDAWISAYNLVSTHEWKGEGNYPTPGEILDVTKYLLGE